MAELTDECIREHCYCWKRGCSEKERIAMTNAEKKGLNPESFRTVKCTYYYPGCYKSWEHDDLTHLPPQMRGFK